MLKSLLLFIVAITLIVGVHEFGHLIIAKLFNVYCYEFSIGMGPKLFSSKKKETEYSVRAIPIGGYVAMAGETEQEGREGIIVPDERRLDNIPKWKRVLILLAGVTMNFFWAWAILSLCIFGMSKMDIQEGYFISDVMEGTPAETAGLEPEDEIKYFVYKGTEVTIEEGFEYIHDGETVTMHIARGKEEKNIEVVPECTEGTDVCTIGIQYSYPQNLFENATILDCWKYGPQLFWQIFFTILTALKTLFTPSGIQSMSGPVGITQAVGQAASSGMLDYAILIAQLGINIGIINLLPLPILDGGQIVFVLYEAVTQKKPSESAKQIITIASWMLILSLMLFVTFNDISKIFF